MSIHYEDKDIHLGSNVVELVALFMHPMQKGKAFVNRNAREIMYGHQSWFQMASK